MTTKEINLMNKLEEKLFDGPIHVHESECALPYDCDCVYGIARKFLVAIKESGCKK